MTFLKYVDKRISTDRLKVIEQANEIINEYRAQGFDLTLRQLYYQFVARDLLPNRQREYKRLGDIISDGRLAGLINWRAIEDRTRNLEKFSSWSSPESIIEACARSFQLDLWEPQEVYVEAWIEKDALIGVLESACDEHRIPYTSCRGFTSQSEMWRASQRFIRKNNFDKRVVVLHLGDHDPSGLDMTRDVEDRLRMFGAHVEVRRLALNMDQVEEYDPPPNPAKGSDPRFQDYADNFGEESWELDALDPVTITEIIQGEVQNLIDVEQWDATLRKEKAHKKDLGIVSQYWDEIVEEYCR